jgi:hypothetical protein
MNITIADFWQFTRLLLNSLAKIAHEIGSLDYFHRCFLAFETYFLAAATISTLFPTNCGLNTFCIYTYYQPIALITCRKAKLTSREIKNISTKSLIVFGNPN